MKTVLVTGASGFIGKNLCSRLERDDTIEILSFTRDHDLDDLKSMIDKSDFVFHLASVMRPEDPSEFEDVNTNLTKNIIDLMSQSPKNAPILMTSSIQAELDNPYGLSKKHAEKIVVEWSKNSKNISYIFRLPNVFGKWSKPNYSSVVATFCYNISHDLEIKINDPTTKLTLVYIDDVVDEFIEAMDGKIDSSDNGFYTIDRKFEITLQSLADKIYDFKNNEKNGLTRNFDNMFDKFLYETYLSFGKS